MEVSSLSHVPHKLTEGKTTGTRTYFCLKSPEIQALSVAPLLKQNTPFRPPVSTRPPIFRRDPAGARSRSGSPPACPARRHSRRTCPGRAHLQRPGELSATAQRPLSDRSATPQLAGGCWRLHFLGRSNSWVALKNLRSQFGEETGPVSKPHFVQRSSQLPQKLRLAHEGILLP